MSRTKGIALPGKSMEEATRNAQRDILPKSPNSPKAVDTATVKSGAEKSPIVSEPSHKDRNATHTDDLQCLEAGIDRYTGIHGHQGAWHERMGGRKGEGQTRRAEVPFP